MTQDYPYATGDLLDEPNTYFYTPDTGPSLLTAWFSQRSRAMPERAAAESGLQAAATRGASLSPLSGSSVDTEDLVDWVIAGLSRGEPDAEAWLWRLHTKLEVGKRLFDAYDTRPPHRPAAQAGHRQLAPLLLLAELVEDQYGKRGDVRLLNALLKATDTLTAHSTDLAQSERARLGRLLRLEADHVTQLLDAPSTSR